MNDKDVTIVIRANPAQFQSAMKAMANGMKSAASTVRSSGGSTFKNFAREASNAFGSVADTIASFAKKAALFIATSSLGLGSFIKLAGELETTQARMSAMSGSTDAAQTALGELYQFTLGKPIAFPDASKAAQILVGYGVDITKVVEEMKTLSTFSIVNGADLNSLALAYGQVQAKGKLMGQEVLQLTNNFVPVSQVIAKHFNVSIKDAQALIEDGKVSAQDFSAAMAGFIPADAIDKQSKTFKNRMISLQGTIRNLGLALLGVKVDPELGLIVEEGGLFDKFSKAVESLTQWLKDNKETLLEVAQTLIDNFVPAVGALTAMFVVAKVAAIGFAIAASPISAIFFAVAAVIIIIIGVLVFLQIKFNIVGKTVSAVGAIFSTVWNWIKINWPLLLAILTGPIGMAVLLIMVNLDKIKALFRAAWNGIKAIFSGVGGFFKGVWDTVVRAFGNIGRAIGNAVGGAVKGAINGALSIAEGAVNGFIRLINGAINLINKIPKVNIGKINEISIPRLAEGGIVPATPGGRLIVAGEGGESEAVIPLSKLNMAKGSGGDTYNFNVNVTVQNDGTDWTEQQSTSMAQSIVRQLRAQGLKIDQMGSLRP